MRSLVRVLAAGLTAAAGLVVSVPAVPAFATGGGISGTVTLPSGAPAPDICVHADPWYGGTDAFATTSSDGTFDLGVADGTYRIQFRDCGTPNDLVTGYWPGKIDINDGTTITVSGAPVTGINEQMLQGGELTGRVLDDNGAPIANADVWLQAPTAPEVSGVQDTRSDNAGNYVMRGVAPGSWRVKAQLPPDYPATFSGDTDDSKSAALFSVAASASTSATDIHLARAATISGTVLDEFGQPRANVCVSAWGSTEYVDLADTQTGTDGSYTLADVHPGMDRVSVSACQGSRVWYRDGDSYAHATAIDAAEGGQATGIDMTLPNGPVISGTVTDASGNPVQGVWITLYDGVTRSSTTGSAISDADGHYVITGLQAKLYVVEADPYQSVRPDLVPQFWPASPDRNGGVPVPAAVSTDGIDFTLPVGGSIAGHVTAAGSGSPLSKICVSAAGQTDAFRSTTSSVDGSYLIQGLESGDYSIRFEDCNHIDNVVSTFWQGSDLLGSGTPVSVSLGDNLTGRDEAMQPGGSMHGRVVDTSGVGIPRICINIASADNTISYGVGVTDSTGAWSTTSLAPGRQFAVSAHACDSSAPWVPRPLPATYGVAASSDLAVPDIVLHHGGAFAGTVTDQYGHPVAGVCVVSQPSDANGTTRYFRTTLNGTYLANGLEPGTYSAWFTDCGVGMVNTYWRSPAYETRATFTVTSDHTTTGIDQTVVIYTLPTVPTAVTVSPGDGAATLSWQPPASAGNTTITGYQVTGPSGTTTLGASARSIHFTGLTNGSTYPLSVAATNAKGAGPAAEVHAALLPVASVQINGPSSIASGAVARLHGRVLLTDGSGADSRVATLYRRPAGATSPWTKFATTRTSADGRWSLAVRPSRPTAFRVAVGGVSARFVQRVSALAAAAVSGNDVLVSTLPRRAYAVLLLERRRADGSWATQVRTRLNGRGRLEVHVAGGRWRGCLPAAGYWAASCSGAVSVG